MWEASVGFRSIWEHVEASPCPKAPWEGLGFGPLVNETPVLVKLEIAQENGKNVGALMYPAEKQTRPTPHLTTPFSSCFHFLIYSGLFVYLCKNTFWAVKTELYRLETYLVCRLSSIHTCTHTRLKTCCVYRTALPLIGHIDHFHMAVGCTSATDVSLPPQRLHPLPRKPWLPGEVHGGKKDVTH